MESMTVVQRRDRPWLDAYVGALIGPFAMPSTEHIRDAVTALVERYPDSRLNWRLDDTGRRWQPTRTAESIVTEAGWCDGRSAAVPPLSGRRWPTAFRRSPSSTARQRIVGRRRGAQLRSRSSTRSSTR